MGHTLELVTITQCIQSVSTGLIIGGTQVQVLLTFAHAALVLAAAQMGPNAGLAAGFKLQPEGGPAPPSASPTPARIDAFQGH